MLWPSARLVHSGTWPLAGGEALAYDLQARYVAQSGQSSFSASKMQTKPCPKRVSFCRALSRPLKEMATHESRWRHPALCRVCLIQDLLRRGGGGGGGILASDSILGQDIWICIVCFGLLVVFVLWYFDIVPTHTKNYTKADIKSIWLAQL